jgi:hypothetical protein
LFLDGEQFLWFGPGFASLGGNSFQAVFEYDISLKYLGKSINCNITNNKIAPMVNRSRSVVGKFINAVTTTRAPAKADNRLGNPFDATNQ